MEKVVKMQALRDWAKHSEHRQISRTVEVTDGIEVEFGDTNHTESFRLVISNEGHETIEVTKVHIRNGSPLIFCNREQKSVKIRQNREHTLYFDVERQYNQSDSIELIRIHLNICTIIRSIKIIFDRDAFIRKQSRRKSYDIPKVFQEILDSIDNYEDCMIALDGLTPKAENLNFHNYGDHFHGLLYLEQIGMERGMQVYNQREAYFQKVKGGYKIFIEDLFETRPSINIGDGIHARKKNDIRTEYNGKVIDLSDDSAVVRFDSNFDRTFKYEGYSVKFSFNPLYFYRLHRTVDMATKMFNENFLFTNKLITSETTQLNVYLDPMSQIRSKTTDIVLPWFNRYLNDYQKDAVLNVLRGECRQMPYIIYGPPGTGKTSTCCEIILQLRANIPQSRILICSQSNSAANLLAERLINSGMLLTSDILRLTSFSFARANRMPDNLIEYSAVYCPNKSTLDDDELEKQLKIDRIYDFKVLRGYRMIVGTTGSMISLVEDSKNVFTHVVIDEAGQCTEVDAIIPILLTGKGRQTIMAGDPNQMPPIIIDNFARDRGLANSFMGRLFERYLDIVDDTMMTIDNFDDYNPRLITKLRLNYRNLPGILDFFNKNFYNNELVPKVSATNGEVALVLDKLISKNVIPKGQANCGLYFCNVNGTNEKLSTTSWCNIQEANQISTLVQNLIHSGINESDIGIITPYALQVKLLRQLLDKQDIKIIEVGTVEQFQGQERLIILLSAVRTCRTQADLDIKRRLGFICCPKRLNVAVSRARALFYVFGQAKLLSMDSLWEQYIEDCKENGTYQSK